MITQKLDELISLNADVFKKELKEVIKPSFDGLDNPEKYDRAVNNIIVQSKRSSLLRQGRLVAAATEYIENRKNKALILSAEMGSGKTDMAIKISMSQKLCPVYFIACPPHLVKTWQEELEINYKNKSAYKAIVVKRFEDLAPYANRNLWNDGIKYYFIVARETLKLSYPKVPAVKIKREYITTEKELDGQSLLVKQLIKVAKCPDCNATVKEGTEQHIDTSTVPLKCECGCVLRQPDRSVSQKMGTREAIADYVFKNFTKGSYNVILDEAHEYKGGNTGQGNAMARLVSGAKKTIALTGTLMNGYASSLFYLLYRLNPHLMKVKLGFDYNQVAQFVSTYGAHEEIVEAKEVTFEGVVTRMGKRINVKEKPKISPYLLSVLLDMTIFLRLDEIKMPSDLQLPDYTEIIDLVPMEEKLREPYFSYLQEITSQIRKDKRLLGNLATDAIAIPDMPFMARSAQDKVFYEPEFTREDFGTTAKERRLVENVRAELDEGRNCLVYLTFTNQVVATDITKILQDEFPSKVVKFLPSSVAPTKRKEWIEKNPCDILIANPELVKTGLTLLQFPTIIFYETTYNVFTLKQASRRSWRIGQKYPVKVIFMAYENTPQHKALELIGAKVAAANSLEGRLSGDDDLSAMGEDEDNIQLALAKAILNNESASKEIKTTTITNFGNDRDFDAFELYYQAKLDEFKANQKTEVVSDIKEISAKDEAEASFVDSNVDFEEIWNQYEKSHALVSAKGFEHWWSVNKVSFIGDRNSRMYKNVATFLLEIYHDGSLYGKQYKYLDSNEKEQTSTSYAGTSHCFERCDEYNKGLIDGLSCGVRRENGISNIVEGIEIYRVKMGKAPFEPVPNSKVLIPIAKFEELVEECKNDVESLANLIREFVDGQKTDKKDEKIVFDSLLDYDGEITSNTFFYYSGKGKNQKKIEVQASNIADYIPEDALKNGVQLSLF